MRYDLVRGVLAAAALAAFAPASMALAAPNNSVSGNGWTASNDIIGQTSTATVVAGGSPLYIPPAGQYTGTVGILMDYGAAGAFVCSGSLIGKRSVLTAAHCVSDGGLERPLSTTIFFNPNQSDVAVYSLPTPPGVVAVNVASYNVNKDYTGQVIDQNDIAVLRLAEDAPSFAQIYGLSDLSSLTGVEHIIAGYGTRSLSGGANGSLPGFSAGVGRLRYAGNRFETRIGDADFGGQWAADLSDGADVDYVYLSDFDNGTAFRDQMCNIAAAYGIAASPKYCNQGIGAFEGIGAGGDSGSPYFVDGKVAAVHSFALWYRADESANRFGQFKGAVPVYIHQAFIAGAVPEPATWAMLILGFGAVGMVARRRNVAVTA